MALRNQPYFPLYVQDYLTDEKLNMCSAASQGVYIKVLCIMHKSKQYGTILLKQNEWQKDSTCQSFARKLSRLLPFDSETIKKALDELVFEDVLQLDEKDGVLSQKRMIKDNDISEKRSKAGSKGGFAKAKGVAKDVANSENEYENEIVNENDIDFKFFWDAYDKKIDRPKCEKKWNKLPEETQLKILSHIEIYKKATPDKQFRKNPLTYLNNESWENEIIEGAKDGIYAKHITEDKLRRIAADIEDEFK